VNSRLLRRPFPPWAQRQREAERKRASTFEKSRGRLERRTLESTTALNEFLRRLGWSSVQQVFRITRERTVWNRQTRSRETSVEMSYGITDMTPTLANAHDLLRQTRGHWGIENRLHYVRDEAFGEDRSRIRKGNAPQVMAALRNSLISAFRLDKIGNVTAALRIFAWNSQRALAWLGILKN
jgi:hypothetical protein